MTFGPLPLHPDFSAHSQFSSPREKFFFTLGMVILPPFWSWWTLRRQFTDRQRLAAFMWSTIYLLVLLATWDLMSERYIMVVYFWPLICLQVSIGLALWLLVRLIGTRWQYYIGLLGVIDALAMTLSHSIFAMAAINRPFPWWDSWAMIQPLLLFAFLHLALDPWRRAVQQFKIRTAPWLAKHNLRWK